MSDISKPLSALTLADIKAFPVWEYSDSGQRDEVLVRPVQILPVDSLSGRLVALEVTLANKDRMWALIGNISSYDPLSTEHFLTLSVRRDGDWVHLARYHDFDVAERGPDAFARLLGLLADDVFPIAYDIRPFALGDPDALHGRISKEPRERLSKSDLIALAVSDF